MGRYLPQAGCGSWPDLISVKLRMKYVEKYKKLGCLCIAWPEGDKGELHDTDRTACPVCGPGRICQAFDNFMYGLILAHIEQIPAFKYAKKQMCRYCFSSGTQGQYSADQGKAASASGDSYGCFLGCQ